MSVGYTGRIPWPARTPPGTSHTHILGQCTGRPDDWSGEGYFTAQILCIFFIFPLFPALCRLGTRGPTHVPPRPLSSGTPRFSIPAEANFRSTIPDEACSRVVVIVVVVVVIVFCCRGRCFLYVEPEIRHPTKNGTIVVLNQR